MVDMYPEKRPDRPRVRIITVSKGDPRAEDSESVANRLLKMPGVIHLFTDRPDRIFDPTNLADYLEKTLGPNFRVGLHGDLIRHAQDASGLTVESLAVKLAKAKCSAYSNYPFGSYLEPLPEEERVRLEMEAIDYDPVVSYRELAMDQSSSLQQSSFSRRRLVHNGYYEISELGNAYRLLVPSEFQKIQPNAKHVSLIVTGRGIGNLEGPFRDRIHRRGGFASGNIGVVSTTGLVDAPGKPIEVERALRSDFPDEEIIKRAVEKYGGVNGSIIEEVVNEMFSDRMLFYEDERLNQVVRGLSLSWIMFGFGEAGRASQCSTTNLERGIPDTSMVCRLHDGHWQEEVITTQVKKPGDPEFCDYHHEIFSRLRVFQH